MVGDLGGGLRAYSAVRGSTSLPGLMFAQTVVRGLLTVLLVVLAVDVLGLIACGGLLKLHVPGACGTGELAGLVSGPFER